MRLLLSPPVIQLLSILLAGLVYWRMDPKRRPPFPILALRWFLGVLFAFSGLAKLIPGFPNTMGPVDLENTLTPHGLATYARFIAVTELGVGLLLLSRRFATLGAIFLAPMLVNILVITASLGWVGTPYVISVLLAMNAALLFYDRHRLLPLLGLAADRTTFRAARSHVRWVLLVAPVLVGLGWIRLGPGNFLGMFLAAALAVALVILDWWHSDSAS
jgi:uncharacterized membrane protein YphA (DoxX/SURF4 family)